MALRDWSPSRILSIWTGWMSGLLLLIIGAVVAMPTGLLIRVTPGSLPLGARILLGVAGLAAVCLPPAVLTYAWYTARLRAWGRGDGPSKRIDPLLEQQIRADVARAQQLAGAPAQEIVPRPGERAPALRRSDDA